MSADILGTSWDQCRSMVQYNFTSTETRRLVRTDSPGRPPRLSHSSWTMSHFKIEVTFEIHPNTAFNSRCRGGLWNKNVIVSVTCNKTPAWPQVMTKPKQDKTRQIKTKQTHENTHRKYFYHVMLEVADWMLAGEYKCKAILAKADCITLRRSEASFSSSSSSSLFFFFLLLLLLILLLPPPPAPPSSLSFLRSEHFFLSQKRLTLTSLK